VSIEFLDKSYREQYKIDHEFQLSVFNAQSQKPTEKKYFYRFELFREELLKILYEKANKKPIYLPTTWLKIRHEIRELQALTNIAKNKFAVFGSNNDYLMNDKFKEACQSIDPKITDAEYILLREYLDKTSVIYFKPGMDKVFVKPSWITDGVYEILNDKVLKQGGVFSRTDIESSQAVEWDLLLNLMETENIIFSKDENNNIINTFIAPQYFDKKPPNEDLFKIATTGLTQYSITLKMPIFHYKRVLRRIITQYHRDNPNLVKTFWRDGILFITADETRILISGSYQKDDIEGKILLSVEQKGKYTEKQKEIFKLILTEFNNTTKNDLNADIKISLDGNYFIAFKELQSYADIGMIVFRINDKSFRLKDFEIFLNRTIAKPIRVFVSYAHQDIELQNRLKRHLAPLINMNRIEMWTDEAIRAGEHWEEAILGNLRKADIILLLISSDFNASRYIWEKELKESIERHDLGDAKVIPIALRPCSWSGMPYKEGKFQAIPEFNKKLKSITEWDNQDAAFTEIAEQIEKVIKEFKA
jgi:C-terminal of Roc, COR, domain/TIR domain